jgi:hypothetical protein
MPGPPSGDMYNRLLVLSELLDRAVAEVQRAIDDAKGGGPNHPLDRPGVWLGDSDGRSSDDQ